jgi:hypothetical protein
MFAKGCRIHEAERFHNSLGHDRHDLPPTRKQRSEPRRRGANDVSQLRQYHPLADARGSEQHQQPMQEY